MAFGYLAILLGYLSLHQPFRATFRKSHSSKSMGPLLDSIREFIKHHEVMEATLQENSIMDDDARVHGGYTDKLLKLVEQIENDAVFD